MDIRLIERFDVGLDEATLLGRLVHEVAWRAESITLFGRRVLQPRLVAWYGDAGARYRYSGTDHDPLSWIPLLDQLRSRVAEAAGCPFNSVLCNLYRDGTDSMGYHADDERELGPMPVIASFSVGAERTMLFRHRRDRTVPTERISLPSMSLLVMSGTTQQDWHHAIPKTKRPLGPRVNLTFRRILVPTDAR
jgi:alkylated DNA repair dioxygenase AlkB